MLHSLRVDAVSILRTDNIGINGVVLMIPRMKSGLEIDTGQTRLECSLLLSTTTTRQTGFVSPKGVKCVC